METGMPRNHKGTSRPPQRERADEQPAFPLAPRDMLQLASRMLSSQQQLLDLASISIEGAKVSLRQLQNQMDYFAALTECRDLPSLMRLNLEFTERMARAAEGGLENMARLGSGAPAACDKLTRSMALHSAPK
jgi:hypothetical protein